MKKELRLLLVLDTFILMTGGVLTPLWSVLVFKIGGDLRTAGIAISIFSIGTAFFTLKCAYLESKYHCYDKALIMGSVLLCIGAGGYFLVKTPYELFIVQVILGLAAGLQNPAYAQLFNDKIEHGRAGFSWGLWDTCSTLSLGTAALIGSFVAHHLGFRSVFSVIFSLALISLFLTIYTVRKLKVTKARR